MDRRSDMWGVSVVICSHNGADRLPSALSRLAAQQVLPGTLWEVVVVDNASTDGTAAVAKANWPVDAPSPLRVVHEPKLGLTQARCRGLKEAQYELVSFIDDDNWPAPDWITIVANVMEHQPAIGACGGSLNAECELPPPPWLNSCLEYYAVGRQSQAGGDVTWTRGYLWGAGLTVRRSAWNALTAAGFCFRLDDRAGPGLTSGGDAELCLALRLAGWKLWYEPTLIMQHFIPANRMEWNYAKRLAQGFGTSAPVLNAYSTIRKDESAGILFWMRSNWICQALVTTMRVIKAFGRCLLGFPLCRGSEAALDMIYRFETLMQFLQMRRKYDSLCRDVRRIFRAGKVSNSTNFVEAC